jgi:hypothetical protein
MTAWQIITVRKYKYICPNQKEPNMDRDYDDQFADEMEMGPEDNLSDVEADAMTLRDAGYGTDEDYGYASDVI